MEGSRPLLVEVQALVAPTQLVPPRRVANGVDRNRLALMLAVLARHARSRLGSNDVFVSVAGGVRVEEPGADLAIALAVASAARGGARHGDRPLAVFGEIGLTGELRYVAHPDRRTAEAAKFGLSPVVSGRRPHAESRVAGRAAPRRGRRRWPDGSLSMASLARAARRRMLHVVLDRLDLLPCRASSIASGGMPCRPRPRRFRRSRQQRDLVLETADTVDVPSSSLMRKEP